MERPVRIRLAAQLALLAGGLLVCTQGCRSTKSEVPAGKPYQTSGTPPTVGFSTEPHPNTATGMAWALREQGPRRAGVGWSRPVIFQWRHGLRNAAARVREPWCAHEQPLRTARNGRERQLHRERPGSTRGFPVEDDGPGVAGPGQGPGDASGIGGLARGQLSLIAGVLPAARRNGGQAHARAAACALRG